MHLRAQTHRRSFQQNGGRDRPKLSATFCLMSQIPLLWSEPETEMQLAAHRFSWCWTLAYSGHQCEMQGCSNSSKQCVPHSPWSLLLKWKKVHVVFIAATEWLESCRVSFLRCMCCGTVWASIFFLKLLFIWNTPTWNLEQSSVAVVHGPLGILGFFPSTCREGRHCCIPLLTVTYEEVTVLELLNDHLQRLESWQKYCLKMVQVEKILLFVKITSLAVSIQKSTRTWVFLRHFATHEEEDKSCKDWGSQNYNTHWGIQKPTENPVSSVVGLNWTRWSSWILFFHQ